MIASMDDHRGDYGIEPICRVLPIAPSTPVSMTSIRAAALYSIEKLTVFCSTQTDVCKILHAF